MPIGTGARYAKQASILFTYPSGPLSGNFNILFGTVQIAVAATSDPLVALEDNLDSFGSTYRPKYNNSIWYQLHDRNGGNFCYATAPADVAYFLYASVNPLNTGFPFNYNPWSAPPVSPHIPIAPGAYYSGYFYMPANVCGSPDGDGLTSIIQPPSVGHFAVDLYAPIVLPTPGNGSPNPIVIAAQIGSYYDLTGDGTGYWNGRRASMFPTIAGVIRDGEIARGVIPHAIAIDVYEKALTNVANTVTSSNGAVWPAYSYDQPSSGGYGNCGTCLPMGTLLAIPPGIIGSHKFYTSSGAIIATAAQNYGVYIVDATRGPEVAWEGQLGNSDANGQARGYLDLEWIQRQLRQILNNAPGSVGGGGTPIAPLAPPFSGE